MVVEPVSAEDTKMLIKCGRNVIESAQHFHSVRLLTSSFICQCHSDYAGNGLLCAEDFDIDGFPDVQLNCSEKECRKVGIYGKQAQLRSRLVYLF